mgnify:CR=1 FL=1
MRRFLPVILAILVPFCGGCGDQPAAELPAGYLVLAEARGDLGGGESTLVRLVGRAGPGEGPFREDFRLAVGRSSQLWPLPSACAAGYGPGLALVDVTGDGRPEAVDTADTGGSGGLVGAVVVAIAPDGGHWRCRSLFDNESGVRPALTVVLVDGFTARLEIRAPGLPDRREVLDLAGRRDRYLATGVYTEDGELAAPVAIWGDALMAVEPLRADAGGPGLRLVQQPRGASNADRLAEVVTVLVWRERTWHAADVAVRPLER